MGMTFALFWASTFLMGSVPGPPPSVVSVELRLPSDAEASLVQEAPTWVTIRKGQVYSLRAVRRTIEILWATQRFSDVVVRRFDEPEGLRLVFELSPRRSIAFVRVSGVSSLTEEEATRASGLRPGMEAFPERMAHAEAQLLTELRRRGFAHAHVSSEAGDFGRGLEVTLAVSEGPPSRIHSILFSGAPGVPATQLREILGMGPGSVLDYSMLEQGISRLRNFYRDEAFYQAVVSEPIVESRPEATLLVIPVSAGPRFEVHFRGNRRFSDGLLRGVVGYDGAETLDDSVKARLAERLRTYYRFRGFHDVEVGVREVRSPLETRAVLRFDVMEGNPLFVRELLLSGNRFVSSAQLRQVLADTLAANAPSFRGESERREDPLSLEGRTSSLGTTGASFIEPSSIFVESAYEEAAKAMEELYRSRGFLSAQVRLAAVSIDVDRRSATVGFSIKEGPLATLVSVEWKGLPPPITPLPMGEVAVGKPFQPGRAEELRSQMVRWLGRQGYLYSNIEMVPEVSKEGRSVGLTYRVIAGPQVRVGKVVFQGLERTEKWWVSTQVLLKEGDVLDTELLYDTQKQLVVLGIFRTVAVRLLSPDLLEPTKDIVIEVRERPRLLSEWGYGYFFAEGPRMILDWAYPNAFGVGLNVSGRGKVHFFGASGPVLTNQADVSQLTPLEQLGGQQTISLQSRGLLPAQIGARLDLPIERVILRFFRYTRFAAVPGLDWERDVIFPQIDWARLRIGLNVQYEVENVSLDSQGVLGQLLPTLATSDQSRLRFPEGTFALQTVRFSQTFDFRDSPTNPTRGILLSLSEERTWDIFTQDRNGTSGAPIQTLRISGNLSSYVPLGRSWVLALSARGGRILPLEPDSRTIAPKRFFLGGASSMRGFREDGVIPADRREDLANELNACRKLANPTGCTEAALALQEGREIPSEGGELFVLGKGELRFPISRSFDLGLFLEAGNLWLSPQRWRPFQFRYVAGAGLRFVTPIGPLSLDVGANLQPDLLVNEPLFNLHFNIGLF